MEVLGLPGQKVSEIPPTSWSWWCMLFIPAMEEALSRRNGEKHESLSEKLLKAKRTGGHASSSRALE
jgi:hypothetical protein